MSEKRSFTIDNADVAFKSDDAGRFESKTPRGAAAKAARKLFSLFPKRHSIRFTMRETTMNSAKKEFTYIGLKEDLPEPLVINRGGVNITIKNKFIVRACHA